MCGYKESCYFETVEGITDLPPYAVCAPTDPCHKSDCGQNYECKVLRDGDRPPKASCSPQIDLCKGTKCSALQQCYVTSDTAIEGPNGNDLISQSEPALPRPVCAYSNPCIINNCKHGFECALDYLGDSNIPNARCDPIRYPCLGMVCNVDEQCYVSDMYVQDLTIPIGQCYPVDPCSNLNCRDGFTCVDLGTIPPSAECVLVVDPCENVTCNSPQKCYLEYVTCIKAPCYPVARCADPNPCKNHVCQTGYECINYYDDPYTAPRPKCVNPQNPCENFPCGKDQVCTCLLYTSRCV